MASAIEMPLSGPASSDDARSVVLSNGGTPPFFHWVKIGFAFAIGVWLAAVLLLIPTFIIGMRMQLLIWQALLR